MAIPFIAPASAGSANRARCAALNQAIAYFNLSLERIGKSQPGGTTPFSEERELQVVCAPRVAGRVKYDSAATPGGYLSILSVNRWDAGCRAGPIGN